MRITTSYVREEEITPLEIEKTMCAADARYRLALIQHGCSDWEQLPEKVRDELEALWQISLGELRDRHTTVLESFWVGDPADMPDEIRA